MLGHIVGGLQQGLEVLGRLGELPVVAGLSAIAHGVVVLDGLLEVFQLQPVFSAISSMDWHSKKLCSWVSAP